MRKLTLFALPFAVGCGLCQYLLPSGAYPLAALAALVIGAVVALLWKDRRRQTAIAAVGLTVGILWFAGYESLFLAPAEALVDSQDTVTVELTDYPESTDYGAACQARVLDRGLYGKAMFYGDETLLDLVPGNRVTATVRFDTAQAVSGTETNYFTAQGIFLRLTDQGEGTTVEEGNAGSLRYLPSRLGKALRDAAGTIYNEPESGFLTALLTGDRSGLDDESYVALSEAGLMHITAVSGLHCGFLIALLGLLVLRRQRLTALIGYPVLVVYALAVGATPSVVRASIMVGFALLAPLLGREGDGVTSLSAAGLAILLLNPYAVASVSFQMSFASVAGLLLVTPRAYGLLGGNRKWKDRRVGRVVRLLAGTVSASLGAMVFTAPLGAVYFGYLSFVSPLSNLLVLWLMPVLFGAALLVTLLCVFWPGLAPLAALPALMSRYVLWAAKLTASLKGHGVAFTEKAMVAWLVFVYLLLAVCVISRERRRKYIVAALVAAVTGVCAHALPALTVQGGALTVVAVDVGQGSATLLSSDGATALVDCGSLYWSRGPGNAVADAMESYGWDSLDYVALTHYHADHADGLGELLARVKVEQLLLPEPVEGDSSSLQETVLSLAERYDVPVSFVTTEQTVSLGEATLTAYPPLGDGGTNEVGLTLLCTTGDFDVLITGDMSDSTEALLVDAYTLPDIEVLMVGHHGSKYATSDALLAAVTPEVGIISVGENRYGHPTEEAMGRMTGRDMDIYRTDLQGNIVIRVNG